MLTAASLLQRAGLGAQQDLLASRLVEAAWSLARVAAAVLPARRRAWSEGLATALAADMGSSLLAPESAVARVAIAWVAASAYPTDRLFEARPAFFAVLEGFQPEPLSDALKAHFGPESLSIPLCPAGHEQGLRSPGTTPVPPSMHPSPERRRRSGARGRLRAAASGGGPQPGRTDCTRPVADPACRGDAGPPRRRHARRDRLEAFNHARRCQPDGVCCAP